MSWKMINYFNFAVKDGVKEEWREENTTGI
jgi:hypothetical protein